MSDTLQTILYLCASACFIISLRGLSHPKSAARGNYIGILGMVLAVVATMLAPTVQSYLMIILGLVLGGGVGFVIARRIEMTALPQLVAAFHSLVGLAAVWVACAAYLSPAAFGIGTPGQIQTVSLIEMSIGVAIGAVTFTGSMVAFAKLQGLMSGKPVTFALQHFLNLTILVLICWLTFLFVKSESMAAFLLIIAMSALLGVTLIIPIGGADMPVIVSMLNSYSGWAAAGIGFTLENHLLIITGALVGSSGAILSYIMCKGMNRSFISVLLGGFGAEGAQQQGTEASDKTHRSGSAEDAAFMLDVAESVVIVPGYGMAVAQAQHALKDLTNHLKSQGKQVRFAIHPVAGRMPGHMNVLLAEANVPYEDVLELEEINRDFKSTDVAIVIGANDVTNPAAQTDTTSPIYGMPILDVQAAKSVLFIKRSLSPGYAGVDNVLFYRENTMMLFGDAKKMCEDILKSSEAL